MTAVRSGVQGEAKQTDVNEQLYRHKPWLLWITL